MADLIFQNDVVTLTVMIGSTGKRRLYVTAKDGSEGFQMSWPQGLNAYYLKSRDTLVFKNTRGRKDPLGANISTSIQSKMIQRVRHVYEAIDRLLSDLFMEIDELYNTNIEKRRGAVHYMSLPYIYAPNSADKICGYDLATKRSKHICTVNDGDRLLKCRLFSAKQVEWLKDHAVTESMIRDSIHIWNLNDDVDPLN